jgi:hypothetical protein
MMPAWVIAKTRDAEDAERKLGKAPVDVAFGRPTASEAFSDLSRPLRWRRPNLGAIDTALFAPALRDERSGGVRCERHWHVGLAVAYAVGKDRRMADEPDGTHRHAP